MFRGRAVGNTAPTSDVAEIRRALAVLIDPQQAVELRCLPSGRSVVGGIEDINRLVEWVGRQDDYSGIYYALNPVAPTAERASKATVVARRWMLLDVDRTKTEADKDMSATADEHEATRALADTILTELASEGWPMPVIVNSGNGYHLLYRVDLPHSDHSHQMVRRVLSAIADRFDRPAAKLDRAVYDAPRIAKLPGTWARKGPNTEDRPHRICRLVTVPTTIEVVPTEILHATAGGETPPPTSPGPDRPPNRGLRGRATSGDRDAAYYRRALELETARVALAGPGQRNASLNRAAFSLAQLIGPGQLDRQTIEDALRRAAIACGLDRDTGCGLAGIESTLRSGIEAGLQHHRSRPDEAEPSSRKRANKAAIPARGWADGESIIYRASTVTPKRIEWLWPGRIPVGKLTTFAGIGGLGKTFVLCDITARITSGLPWPDGAAMTERAVGQVLFVSGEDDADDTLVPRLIRLGADLKRVLFLRTEVQDQFTLADLDTLDEAIRQAGDDVRLVVIDPPTAYLGGVDDHSNSELRGLLSPLKSWAARHRVGVIFNTHVNKGGAGKTEAMMRVMGSVAWVNAVRAAYMFARSAEDETKVLFVPMKMNIARKQKGLAYRITPDTADPDGPACVEWLGEVDTTADEAVSRDLKPRQRQATEWLTELFREKLEWRSDDFWRSAKENRISKNAIDEARACMHVPKPRRCCTKDGEIYWVWWVPPDWPYLTVEYTGRPEPGKSPDHTPTISGELGDLEQDIQW